MPSHTRRAQLGGPPPEPLVPADPGQSFVPVLRVRVVPHYCRVAEERGHVVEVTYRHLAERESLCRGRNALMLAQHVSLLVSPRTFTFSGPMLEVAVADRISACPILPRWQE
jgi:hypothetical protein